MAIILPDFRLFFDEILDALRVSALRGRGTGHHGGALLRRRIGCGIPFATRG